MTPTMQTIKGKIVILANHIDILKDRKQITCGEHAQLKGICAKVVELIEKENNKTHYYVSYEFKDKSGVGFGNIELITDRILDMDTINVFSNLIKSEKLKDENASVIIMNIIKLER